MQNDAQIIDLKNLKDNSMGDDAFFYEMIGMFVSQGEEQISSLKKLCTNGENEQWVDTAHALKGTAGSVGAESMRQLCATAQKMFDVSALERQEITGHINAAFLKVKKYLIDHQYIAI